jgi:hypothetical protein
MNTEYETNKQLRNVGTAGYIRIVQNTQGLH